MRGTLAGFTSLGFTVFDVVEAACLVVESGRLATGLLAGGTVLLTGAWDEVPAAEGRGATGLGGVVEGPFSVLVLLEED